MACKSSGLCMAGDRPVHFDSPLPVCQQGSLRPDPVWDLSSSGCTPWNRRCPCRCPDQLRFHLHLGCLAWTASGPAKRCCLSDRYSLT